MILRCACGHIKRGPQQPFRATGVRRWVCPDCRVSSVRAITVLRKTMTFPIRIRLIFESKRSIIGVSHGLLRDVG